LNSFGVFQAYYTTVCLPTESASKISLIGSMQAFLLLFVGVLTGPLIDAGYMSHVLALGTFLSAFGLFMTSLCHTYWQFILAQGIVVGIGSGCLFLPSVAVVPQWFEPKRRNLALGIVAVGSSLGGVVFPVTFHYLVPHVGFGWAVRVIAFLGLATNIPSLAVLRVRVVPPTRRAIVDLSMFKDRAYLIFCLSLFVSFLGLYAPIFYISPYATQIRTVPATVAFYLVPILMLGSAPGRVVPNLIADKIGSLNIYIPAAFISALLAFSWMAISSATGLVVFAILYGMSSGAIVSILPPTVVSIAPDMKNLGTRMGMAFAIASIGLPIGNPIAGAFVKRGSYAGLQAFSGACLLVCTMLVVWVRFVKVGWKIRVKV
jgi:MFS family permease